MANFLSHTTNPRTGRPEGHIAWSLMNTFAWVTWGLAAAMIIFAATDYLRWGRLDNLPIWLGAAAIPGAYGLVAHTIVRRKKWQYREAVAAYEAGLARAALEIG